MYWPSFWAGIVTLGGYWLSVLYGGSCDAACVEAVNAYCSNGGCF